MGDIYRPKEGERVRVVYEGKARSADAVGFSIKDVPFFFDDKSLVSIEKLEPPVEVFPPGSVVRHRGDKDGLWYAIAEDGWLITGPGWEISKTLTKGDPSKEFTSDIFELVPLG